jgi:serine/threonine protein kinase
MGEVHVVRHPELGEVVMKLVLPLGPDVAELVKKRTIAEGRTLRNLSHPNIVALHDLGFTASGRPWLVTELLRGRTLKEEVDRGPLPWPEVARILRDVLGAL